MIFGHLAEWWMSLDSFYLLNELIIFLDAMGGTGFIFISGISLTLSYRNKMKRIKEEEDFSYNKIRLNYLLRGVFLFIVGLIYNTIDAILSNDFSLIWNWFILMTLAVSILMAWPLLGRKKSVKIFAGIFFLILDFFLYNYLTPYKFQMGHPFSIIYYFLYNGDQLTPILSHFPFFLAGSIVGDMIFTEYYKHQEAEPSSKKVFKDINLPLLISGAISIFIAFFIIPFPVIVEDFLWHKRNIAWVSYAIGLLIIVVPSLLYIETLDVIHINKRYRFYFYFSYYSFSIFLLHYSLYFLFTHMLSLFVFIPTIIITILLIGLFLKLIYKVLGSKFSLKFQLARLANGITEEIVKYKPEFKKNKPLLSK
jgi:hypothetical protein